MDNMTKVKYLFWSMRRPTGPYTGMFPPGFIDKLKRLIPWSENILHVPSGTSQVGLTVDLNLEFRPKVMADAHNLPFRDDCFDIVLTDPPYNDDYVMHYSETSQTLKRGFPDFKVNNFMKECSRVCRPGGYVILLHWLMVPRPVYLTPIIRIALSLGPNKRIRCVQIFYKAETTLLPYMECHN